MTKPLFTGNALSDYLAQKQREALQEIAQLDGDNLLSFAPETLARGLATRYQIEPLKFADNSEVVDVRETRIDARGLPDRDVIDDGYPIWIDGTEVTLRLPFSGSVDLLKLRASMGNASPRNADIVYDQLVFIRAWPGTPVSEEVKKWVQEVIAVIRQQSGFQDPQLRDHNASLEPALLVAINTRRASLLAKRSLQASLPFKMTERADAPLTFVPPGVQKRPALVPAGQAAGVETFEPEAALSDKQFEDILRTLRAMGHSMERTPGAFAKLDEEELRSVFLAALNAQFEGGATGETFNAAGKTDILIRYGDRNLFIGECKIWDGPATLSKAVDQVLSYLCWRDSHAAILMFVRTEAMNAVLAKIPVTVVAHGNYLRSVRTVGESEWHYRFSQTDDAARELTLAILAFHFRG
jgi:hypothetical protein